MAHYVILDCDGGSDDAWALLLLLKAHDLQDIVLLGITVCGAGNTTMQNAAHNVLRILKLRNHLEIPVFLGCEKFLLHPTDLHLKKQTFHGCDGFADILSPDSDISEGLIQKQFAVTAINQICCEKPKQVTIICVGPLTNIALCYAFYDEAFANNVKSMYIMGGNYQGVGNHTKAAEFNFYVDPEAAQIVLSRSICPVIILPWEPCTEDRFPLSIEWRLKQFAPKTGHHAAIQLLNKVEAAQYVPPITTWNPCDALLVAVFLFGKQFIVKQSNWNCVVSLTGETRGQMILDHLKDAYKNPINVRLIEAVNAQFFMSVCEWCADLKSLNATFDE